MVRFFSVIISTLVVVGLLNMAEGYAKGRGGCSGGACGAVVVVPVAPVPVVVPRPVKPVVVVPIAPEATDEAAAVEKKRGPIKKIGGLVKRAGSHIFHRRNRR